MSEVTKPKFDEVNGFAQRHKEWVLETDGTNLMAALCAEQIDPRRTVSNDVVECCTVLGIEGARGSLLKEFRYEGKKKVMLAGGCFREFRS